MAGAGDALAAWTFSRCGPVLGRPWTPCKFSGWRTYRSSEYLKPCGTSHQHELPVPCAWMGWPTPTPPSDATHTPSCQPHGQIAARIHCRYATTLQMAQKRADAESSRPQLRVPRNRIRHRPTQCRLSSTGSPLCGTFLDTKFATQFRTVDVSVAFCHFVAPRQAAACFKSGH